MKWLVCMVILLVIFATWFSPILAACPDGRGGSTGCHPALNSFFDSNHPDLEKKMDPRGGTTGPL